MKSAKNTIQKIFIKQLPLLASGLLVFSFAFSLASDFLPLASSAFAAINPQINYQGKLTTASNMAVGDGSYSVRFKLYTVLSGGSPIWTEAWCYSPDSGVTCNGTGSDHRVSVASGIFSTMLGTQTSLAGLNFNQPLYLSVEIGGSNASSSWDGEMSPRKVLGAVPAAFVANSLQGLDSTEFLRSDASNSTSTASTFLSVIQTGAGKIAEFFGQASASVLAILSNGNVGIGTTTPGSRLTVWGSDTGADVLASFVNSASTSLMTILNNGNVGIGTTNPLQTLDMKAGGAYGYNGSAVIMASTTLSNYFFGGAGNILSTATGTNNTAEGFNALHSLTTGYNNAAQGVNALFSNTTGYYNSAQGVNALFSNTTGSYNAAQGVNALFSNTTGSYNAAQGVNALHSNTTGYYNSAQGMNALYSNTTGAYNTAIGYVAGLTLNGGSNNTFLGYGADVSAAASTTLSNSTAIGNGAIVTQSNEMVLGNTSVSQTLLNGNVGIGTTSPIARLDSETGDSVTNTPAGLFYGATTAGTFLAPGYLGRHGTQVNRATLVIGSDYSASTGAALNIYNATTDGLLYVRSDGNVGIGTTAPGQKLDIVAGGAYGYNGIILAYASTSLSNFYFGRAGNLTATGVQNVGIGLNDLSVDSSGAQNTAIGDYALTADTTGSFNTAVAHNALEGNTTGNYNTGVGYGSLFNNTTGTANTGIGYYSGLTLNGGNEDTFIGYDADVAVAASTTLTNCTAVGYNAQCTTNNTMVLGNGENVGIGTTSPAALLDVNGIVRTSNYFEQRDYDTNNWVNGSVGSAIISRNYATMIWQGGLVVGQYALNALPSAYGATGAFLTTGPTALAVNSGDVGIGNASPSAKLDVLNIAGGTTPLLSIASSTNGLGTSTALYIDLNGDIGMGATVSNPLNMVTVIGKTAQATSSGILLVQSKTSAQNNLIAEFAGPASSAGSNYIRISRAPGDAEGTDIEQNSSSGGPLRFGSAYDDTNFVNENYGNINLVTNGVIREVIGSNGNIGIGLTNPAQTLDMKAGGTYGYNGHIIAQASTTLNSYFFGGAGNLTLTGSDNTASGYQSLSANTTGSNNTADGLQSLYSNTTGSNNTAIGYNAGFNGSVPLQTMTNSTFLGVNANSSVDGITNSMALGNGAQVTASNQVVIGNASVTQTLLNGNVGIGTAAPGHTLEVEAPTAAVSVISTTNGNPAYYNFVNNSSGGGGNFGLESSTGGSLLTNSSPNAIVLGTAYFDPLQLGTFGNVRLTIDPSGNVGIGTTSPSSRLTVWGADTGADLLANFTNSASTSVMSILNNGNVGIGTTSPSALLTVGNNNQFTVTNTGVTLGTNFNIGNSLGNPGGGLTIDTTGNLTGANVFGTQFVMRSEEGTSPILALTQVANAGILSLTRGAGAGSSITLAGSTPFNGSLIDGSGLSALTGTAVATGGANGLNFALSSTYDQPYIRGAYFNVTEATTTPGSYGDLAIGVDVLASSSIASAGTWGYGARLTAGTSNITPLLLKGASGQSSDLLDIQNNSGSGLVSVTSSGNVGIGLTSPAQTLDIVAGGAYGYNGIILAYASTSLSNFYFGRAGNLTATGVQNVGIGLNDLSVDSSGAQNTAIGDYALTADTTGSFNTAVAHNALEGNTTGNYNTGVGYGSLFNNTTGTANTGIGYYSGLTLNGGNEDTFLGYGADVSSAASTTLTNSTAIGNGAIVTASNQMVLGSTTVTQTLLNGNVGIGTSTPYDKLSVAGEVAAQDYVATSTTATSTFAGYTSLATTTINTQGDDGFVVSTVSGHAIIFKNLTAGAEHASFTNSNTGYLTSDGSDFGIASDGTTAITNNENLGMKFVVNNSTQAMTILAGGNVGIGTTAPGQNLDMVAGGAYGYNGSAVIMASTTLSNYFFGGAGNILSTATGTNNTAEGFNALHSLTTGYNNAAQGVNALFSNTTGYYNSAQGVNALFSNTTGSYNAAQGVNALFSNTTGSYNAAQGVNALHSNTTGYYNSAQGMNALYSNTTGAYNTAIGYVAGLTLNGGSNNTFLGYGADVSAAASTTLSNSTAIGNGAIVTQSNEMVLGNTSVSQTLLNGNVGIGTTSPIARLDSETGDSVTNTPAGLFYGATTAGTFLAPGYLGRHGTQVNRATLVIGSDYSASTGAALNIYNATTDGLLYVRSDGNVGIGTTAPGQKLDIVAGGAYGYNGIILAYASTSLSNFYFGRAGNLTATGVQNVGIGLNDLSVDSSGAQNTAIGDYALTADTTGSFNTAVAHNALEGNTTGNYNTGVGYGSLFNNTTGTANTGIGYYSGLTLNGGNEDTFIGYDADVAVAASTTLTNCTAVGYNAQCTTNNTMVLGNGENVGIGTSTPTLGPLEMGSGAYVTSGGVWTNASDRNLKENFTALDPRAILGKILTLPVTQWNYKVEPVTTTHIGPVAQDFSAAFGVGGPTGSTTISTIDPSGVALLGLQAIGDAIDLTSAPTTTPSLVISSVGNVGIGTTSPAAGLEVNRANGDVASFHNSAGTGLILANGGTSWSTVSDARLKDNINDLPTSTLADVLALRPVTYNLINDPNAPKQIGLIAQEVQPLFPEEVNAPTGPNGYYSMSYDRFGVIAIKAIQEQNDTITALASTTANLASTTAKLSPNGDICANGVCLGQAVSDINDNIKALAQATTTSSLAVAIDSVDIELNNTNSEVNALATTTQQLAIQVRQLASTTAALAGATANIASTTADKLAQAGSFIQAIAAAVENAIQSTGQWVVAKITATAGKFAELTAGRVTIGSSSVPAGITMYDEINGNPYCFKVMNGVSVTAVGECAPANSDDSDTIAAMPATSTIAAVKIIDNQTAMEADNTVAATVPSVALASTTSASTTVSASSTSLAANGQSSGTSTASTTVAAVMTATSTTGTLASGSNEATTSIETVAASETSGTTTITTTVVGTTVVAGSSALPPVQQGLTTAATPSSPEIAPVTTSTNTPTSPSDNNSPTASAPAASDPSAQATAPASTSASAPATDGGVPAGN